MVMVIATHLQQEDDCDDECDQSEDVELGGVDESTKHVGRLTRDGSSAEDKLMGVVASKAQGARSRAYAWCCGARRGLEPLHGYLVKLEAAHDVMVAYLHRQPPEQQAGEAASAGGGYLLARVHVHVEMLDLTGDMLEVQPYARVVGAAQGALAAAASPRL